MRQYSSNDYRTAGLDTSELDPCIAAETRMKKSVMSSKMKRVLILVGVLVLLLLVLGLLFVVLSSSSDNGVDYEDETLPTDEKDPLSAGASGMFGKQPPVIFPLMKMGSTGKENAPPVSREPAEVRVDTTPVVDITAAAPVVTTTERTVRPTTHRPRPILIPVHTTSTAKPTTTSTSTTTSTTSTTTTSTTTTSPSTTTMSTTTTEEPTTTTTPQPTVKVRVDNYHLNIVSAEPMSDDVKRDCLEHRDSEKGSGIYMLNPDGGNTFDAYCDMETDGGGWTVIQRRVDGKEYFYNRTYAEYEIGFGNLVSSYWLGLSAMRRMAPTGGRDWTLRIELRGDTCESCSHKPDGYWWGEWDFSLGDAANHYPLSISPTQTAGNLSMPQSNGKGHWEQMSNGRPFTTADMDNDSHQYNCAQYRNNGPWWHRDCSLMTLNGMYGDNKNKLRYLVYLYELPYENGQPSASYHVHPRQTLMMIRPRY